MAFFLYKAAAHLLLPPGLFALLFLAVACVGFALLRRHRKGRGPLEARLARRMRLLACLSAAGALLVYLLSISPVLQLLASALQNRISGPTAEQLKEGDCLIILGGGVESYRPKSYDRSSIVLAPSRASMARLAEGAALHRRLSDPRRPLPVILCGGSVFPGSPPESQVAAGLLSRLGIPPQLLVLEDRSRTTRENALFAAALLRTMDLRRPVLVTSALHMPRAVLAFAKAGVAVIPYPVDFLGGSYPYTVGSFFSDPGVFHYLRDILWEYLGLLWYSLR